jgi:hypothetical protein
MFTITWPPQMLLSYRDMATQNLLWLGHVTILLWLGNVQNFYYYMATEILLWLGPVQILPWLVTLNFYYDKATEILLWLGHVQMLPWLSHVQILLWLWVHIYHGLGNMVPFTFLPWFGYCEFYYSMVRCYLIFTMLWIFTMVWVYPILPCFGHMANFEYLPWDGFILFGTFQLYYGMDMV